MENIIDTSNNEFDISLQTHQLINRYFTDNPVNLVAHHLDSYNDFVEKGIPRIISENNPVRFIEPRGVDESDDKRQLNECRVYLGGKDGSKIYYGKPVIYDEHRTHYMYPNDARMRNMTYGITIHYRVDIDFISYSSDGKQIIHDISLDTLMLLGRFPIMLNSNLCVLHGLEREVRFNMGECRNDLGGYFIIDGKEKVIMSQEKFADNIMYVKKNNGDDPYSYSAEVRSLSEDSSKQIRKTRVHIVSGGKHDISVMGTGPKELDIYNADAIKYTPPTTRPKYTYNNIVVAVPNVREPVPLFILMRALGINSDKNIINTCLLGLEKNSDLIELFRPSIHDANRVYSQQGALEYIKSFTKINSVSGVMEILSDYFLPHVGELNFLEKGLYIGTMVKRLLLTYTGQILPTDRDNFRYKRVETSGVLLYDLFREYFLLQHKNITQKIGFEYNNNPGAYVSEGANMGPNGELMSVDQHMLYNLVTLPGNIIEIFKDKILEKGILDAFKGKWGSQAYTKKVGIVQGLDRLSWFAHMHSLRKTNLPLDSSAKITGPRKLHSSQWGLIDPIDSPDGSHVGLHKQLAIVTHITSGFPVTPFIVWLRTHMNVLSTLDYSPDYLGTIAKVMVNGQWSGSVKDPLDLVHKLKVFRRNGIVPTFTSIMFDYKMDEVLIYTDSGRLTRPVYYTQQHGKSEVRKNIRDLVYKNTLSWEQIVSGVGEKSVDNFNHKNNEIYTVASLYPNLESDDSSELMANLENTASVVDYMDSSEAETSKIAISFYDAELDTSNVQKYTHYEIDNSLLLGMLSNQTIYPEHNPLARNVFSCGQAKQAVSLYHSNYQMRMDKMGVVLNYGQIPLIKSKYLKYVNNEEHPNGVNTIVAIAAFTGYNVEDAILVNKGSLDRGLFRTTYLTSYESKEESLVVSGETNSRFANIEAAQNVVGLKRDYDYGKLDERGLIRENTQITDKTILIGKMSNSITSDEWVDDSLKTKRGQLGMVDKTFLTEGEEGFNLAKVRVREDRTPAIGDKMVSRAGQKGTIGLIIPEEDMPFTADGRRPDLIINPHALPSRMTVGQLIETVLGTLCLDIGGFGDSTVFREKGSKLPLYGKLLSKVGLHSEGNQLMYSGLTGEQLDSEIFMGPTYYTRLKHMVKDKVNFRARGKRDMLTRQTNQGRADEGGLRIGEMERDGLLGHGIMAFITDSFMTRGDEYFIGICNKTGTIAVYNEAKNLFYSPFADGPIQFHTNPDASLSLKSVTQHGRSFSLIRVPYSFKLLMQELQAMNIQMRIITDDNVSHMDSMAGSTNITKLLQMDNDLSKLDEVHTTFIKKMKDQIKNVRDNNAKMSQLSLSTDSDLFEQESEIVCQRIPANAKSNTIAKHNADTKTELTFDDLKVKYDLSNFQLSYTDANECAKPENIIPALTDPVEFYTLMGGIDTNEFAKLTDTLSEKRMKTITEIDNYAIYNGLGTQDIINTFNYMFYHIRIGIFVHIKDGKLEQFLPFHNTQYENNWTSEMLTFANESGTGTVSMDKYYADKKKKYRHNADVENNTKKWSANNCLLGTWSETEIGNMGWFELREMIHETCKKHRVNDCVFFVNRRDHPVLTPNGMEPYFHMYDGLNTPLPEKHQHTKYVPVLSFCKNDNFADLIVPNYADWRNVTKKLYPPTCSSMEIDDITLEWDKKLPKAVFRGSATGCGTTPENNQRILISQMATKYEHRNLWDVGLVGMPTRDKKVQGKPIDFFRHKKYNISNKPRMSMNTQSTYKYIVHIDGHVSAYRLGKELSLGSTILKVDSVYNYRLWFDELLTPYEHFIPVKSDLSDLTEIIKSRNKTDDEQGKQVAQNALGLYKNIMTEDFITQYWADMMNAVSTTFVKKN
jgi:DNA-directed RNA polymerase II subunit RPB2